MITVGALSVGSLTGGGAGSPAPAERTSTTDAGAVPGAGNATDSSSAVPTAGTDAGRSGGGNGGLAVEPQVAGGELGVGTTTDVEADDRLTITNRVFAKAPGEDPLYRETWIDLSCVKNEFRAAVCDAVDRLPDEEGDGTR